jgi:hypothetical protein
VTCLKTWLNFSEKSAVEIKKGIPMKNLILSISFLLFCNQSIAIGSTIDNTFIIEILAGEINGNVAILKISPKPTNSPSCATNPNFSYAFDISTEVGKATLSMVLTAYAANKKIYLDGDGSCSLYSRIESLRQIRLK